MCCFLFAETLWFGVFLVYTVIDCCIVFVFEHELLVNFFCFPCFVFSLLFGASVMIYQAAGCS